MNTSPLQSCHLGPGISPEQVISDHFFLYLLKGAMIAYNGNKYYQFNSGDSCIARKNHLLRYNKQQMDGEFKKIVIVLDEAFLKRFLARHPTCISISDQDDSILPVKDDRLLTSFIRSLEPYYKGEAVIEEAFADLKREELLLILLEKDPGLANVFFNFSAPEKIDIEAFMSQNFKFNVPLERFAFLTGRSLSALNAISNKPLMIRPDIG